MDVFQVPVGGDRYELYCEAPAEDPTATAADGPAWWRRQIARFRQTLAEAEREQDPRAAGQPAERRGLWRAIVRKLAVVVAEQRLLWRLRGAPEARLVHAADLGADAAERLLRGELRRDFEKHRRWMVINAIAFLPFIVLTPIPGPNIPALYFSFRALGHFFSMRGAGHGLRRVAWRPAASPELAALRQALALDPAERRTRVDAVAGALGLERLAAFVERVARRPA